jgi:hypothetical protein
LFAIVASKVGEGYRDPRSPARLNVRLDLVPAPQPGPARYFEPNRFDTMPSQPSLQAWAKIGFDLVDGS